MVSIIVLHYHSCYHCSSQDMEVLGVIRVDEMLGVSRLHDEDQSSSHKFSFEVITPSRAYLFSAESEDDMISWIDTINLVSSELKWKIACSLIPLLFPIVDTSRHRWTAGKYVVLIMKGVCVCVCTSCIHSWDTCWICISSTAWTHIL